MNDADKNLHAEIRGIEEGHRAFVQDGGWVMVTSDTHPGKKYRVEFHAHVVGDGIIFTCKPDHGPGLYQDDHLFITGRPGVVPCKHAALAARRLEREGLAIFNGSWWTVTEKGAPPSKTKVPDDPFAGL